jgi:1-phosphatidylinositol-3-phosphate 5-kinase
MKGISLFTEIANCLKTIPFDGSTTSNRGSIREFSEVEKMLMQEREEFEVRFLLVHDFDIS